MEFVFTASVIPFSFVVDYLARLLLPSPRIESQVAFRTASRSTNWVIGVHVFVT
jgi:hypothetical protein